MLLTATNAETATLRSSPPSEMMRRCSYCGVGILLLVARDHVHSQQRYLSISPVEVQMRVVNLHLDRSTVLEISRLRGQMIPIKRERPVTFDDPNSFVIRITSAEVAISTRTLADLLNQRVFNYRDAPLKKITISTDQGKIVEKGLMHKVMDIPFEVKGTLDVNAAGDVRLRAGRVEAAHVSAKELLHLFGGDLSKLVNLKQDRGVRIEGDDILLSPATILPPPKIEGTVTGVRVEGDRIVLTFGAATSTGLRPPFKAASYIYHRGGVLRFGKLTMTDSDLELVNYPPHSPFDFSLPDYNRQLVAGYSNNTVNHGLIVFMPDLKSLPANR